MGRKRLGYRNLILDSYEQAKRDGYAKSWVHTCYIDKRSSAELQVSI